MGAFQSKNNFPVKGRTVLVTGGSLGMGRAIACLLAKRGANVVIVARKIAVLEEALEEISNFASEPASQRFHTISADLTSALECTRMISEATTWNKGSPPDVVFCVAGSSHPGLFTELAPEVFKEQMDVNYFSGVYTAQAAVRAWLSASASASKSDIVKESVGNGGEGESAAAKVSTTPKSQSGRKEPKHLIFTSSVVAFLPLCGYTPYTPAKCALRALSETLSQEMLLYAHHTPIQTHTVFPATIFTASLDRENETKAAITKKLEEADGGQTPMQVAEATLKGLDRGEESIVTSGLQGMALRACMMGWTRRAGLGILDTIMVWIVAIVIVFVRRDMNGTVKKWAVKEQSSAKVT